MAGSVLCGQDLLRRLGAVTQLIEQLRMAVPGRADD